MKHWILTFLGIITVSCSFGQNTPMIKFYTEKEVLKEFYKNSQLKSNIALNYKVSDFKNGDTLILKIEGQESITVKLTFKLELGYCDFQTVEFCCDSCAIKQANEILNLKYCGWKKLSEDKYLSKYHIQTELEISKIDNLIKTLTYRYVDKPRKVFKNEYKSL